MYYNRLKEMRESKGITQSEIAELLHTTQTQYHLYESGKRELPAHCFIELAKFYNVTVDYLLGLSDS